VVQETYSKLACVREKDSVLKSQCGLGTLPSPHISHTARKLASLESECA
jgi:hypothetical protein